MEISLLGDSQNEPKRAHGRQRSYRSKILRKLLAPVSPKKVETQARGRFDDSGLVELLGLGVLPRA